MSRSTLGLVVLCLLLVGALVVLTRPDDTPPSPSADVGARRSTTRTRGASMGVDVDASTARAPESGKNPSNDSTAESSRTESSRVDEPAAKTLALFAKPPHDVDARDEVAGAPSPDEDDQRGYRHVYAPDRTGIQAAVREAKPLIQECYEGWVRVHPDLAGKIVVAFTIADPSDDDDDEARITEVEINESTVAHESLEGCVRNVVSGLRFERPEGGTLKVSYPFVFAARSP